MMVGPDMTCICCPTYEKLAPMNGCRPFEGGGIVLLTMTRHPDHLDRDARRLAPALAGSAVLHALMLSVAGYGLPGGLPGTTSGIDASTPIPLSVRFAGDRHDGAASDGADDATTQAPTPERRSPPGEENKQPATPNPAPAAAARPAADASPPLPSVIYYPTHFLSLRPQPVGEADLDPPHLRPVIASGKIVLRLWIHPLGSTVRVVVEGSDMPQAFIDNAVVAFERLRFQPGELYGQKVGALMRVEVTYADGRMTKTLLDGFAPAGTAP